MKENKLNLTLPLVTTFFLMMLVVIYTSAQFYRISVSNIYEVGSDKISGISASFGNYLDTNKSVLWVTADTVDFMVRHGESNETIREYLILESERYKGQFDENYTGLYGFISGEYLDGLEWVPPEDYNPAERDWYRLAVRENGLVVVPPYLDAQTGEMVISFTKHLSDSSNVIAIDLFTTHIQDVIRKTSINGKGYGFIVDKHGMVIAHADASLIGDNYASVSGGAELIRKLNEEGQGRFETEIDGKLCTVFNDEIMDQWHLVIVVGNDALFQPVYSQLTVNIIVYAIVFVLIALFYYFAYRKEEKSRREAETLRISEQQKAYEAELLRLEKSAADSANKAKGDFLAQMSHEIRTPINAVLGMNEMILRESDDESILEYSRNIQVAGKTLLSLVNSILDFSKIEDGKMEIIPGKYDTVSLISNLINSVSERARSKGLEFTVHADPGLPSMLIGDDVRIAQVIVNLLTNAVKYTERGSVTLEMQCGQRTESAVIIAVAVKDTGIGIREEDMEKLFESFARLDENRNRHIEGTGLGMAIVTKLLALMGSELHVESVYGEGSVFSFEIRQEIADAKPIGTEPERRIEPENRREKVYPHFPGAKILVTDDNEMNRMVVKNLMKLFGIQPDLAASGPETVSLMRENTYSIVFLDHMMPKMDGIETLKLLRTEKLIPEGTVMIALTANAIIGAKEKYLAEGFDDYLSKPINLDELSEKLTAFLKAPDAVSEEEAPEEEPEVVEFLPDDADDEVIEFTPGSASEDLSERLAAEGFSAESGLKYCAGDMDFYRDMLTEYAGSAEARLAELDDALLADDLARYQISVHALKSTSATVGADDVSALARLLEDAAKAKDADTVRGRHGELAALLRRRAETVRRLLHISE